MSDQDRIRELQEKIQAMRANPALVTGSDYREAVAELMRLKRRRKKDSKEKRGNT